MTNWNKDTCPTCFYYNNGATPRDRLPNVVLPKAPCVAPLSCSLYVRAFPQARITNNPTQRDHDPVNHPAHYTSHPSGVEAIQVCEHHNFCIGNAIKYLWRAGQKGDGGKHVEDLRKAIWYINREIQRLDGKHDTD